MQIDLFHDALNWNSNAFNLNSKLQISLFCLFSNINNVKTANIVNLFIAGKFDFILQNYLRLLLLRLSQ